MKLGKAGGTLGLVLVLGGCGGTAMLSFIMLGASRQLGVRGSNAPEILPMKLGKAGGVLGLALGACVLGYRSAPENDAAFCARLGKSCGKGSLPRRPVRFAGRNRGERVRFVGVAHAAQERNPTTNRAFAMGGALWGEMGAVDADNRPWCRGPNSRYGRLATRRPRTQTGAVLSQPAQVAALEAQVAEVALSTHLACGRKTDGTASRARSRGWR